MRFIIKLDPDDMKKLNNGDSVDVIPSKRCYDNLTKITVEGVRTDGDRQEETE